jgi:hypothetical protein
VLLVKVKVIPGLGKVTLRWNGEQTENAFDVFSSQKDFEGYRIYYSRGERLADGVPWPWLCCANAVPQECVQIQNLFNKGRMNEARLLQEELTPLAKAVTTKYGIGGLKMAMDLAGYFGGNPRSPLKRPGGEVEEELKRLLLKLKGLKWMAGLVAKK